MQRRVVIGLALGALAVWFATRAATWTEVAGAFSSMRWSVLLPVALIFLLQQGARAWRQLLLVQPVAPGARYMTQLGVLCMSFFCINSLPARLGEVVRPWLLYRKEGIQMGAGIAVVVVERVIDLAATLILLGVALWLADLPSSSWVIWGNTVQIDLLIRSIGLGIICPVALGLVVIVFAGESLVERLEHALPSSTWLSRLSELVGSFVLALRGVGSVSRVLAVVGITAITWAGTAEMIRMLAQAAGLGSFIGYPEALGVLALTMLSTALPAPPAFIGVYEAGALAALALFGVPTEQVMAEGLVFALVLHWWIYLVQSASALGFFLVDEMGLYEVVSEARRSQRA